MKSLSHAIGPRLKRMAKNYPFTDKFNPEALARWHIKYPRQTSNTVQIQAWGTKELKTVTWIGNKGPLADATRSMRWHYLRCAELQNEDAAKTWAWLQGYIVNRAISYVENFTQRMATDN